MPRGKRGVPARLVSKSELDYARTRLQDQHKDLDDPTLIRLLASLSKDILLVTEDCNLCNGARCQSGPSKGRDHRVIRFKGQMVLAHRLFFELFVSPIPEGMCVLHSCPVDSDGRCCNVRHLRIGTKTENAHDRKSAGNDRIGEDNGQHKLTEEEVSQIRQFARDGMPRTSIAHLFGISSSLVCLIARHEVWAHLRETTGDGLHEQRSAAVKNKSQPGEAHPRARLTEENILEIRRLAAEGESQSKIAVKFGVAQPYVSRIIRREAWTHA